MSEFEGAHVVRLEIPAEPQFLRVARLTVAAAAGGCGFDVEEIEDLRIAVAEATSVLIDGGGASVELVVRTGPGHVHVSGRSPSVALRVPDALTEQVMAALVRDFRCWESDGHAAFSFSMAAQADVPGDQGAPEPPSPGAAAPAPPGAT